MVKQGKRYQATIRLSFVQSWFGNDAVAGKFEQVGFTEVKVTGSGRDRPHPDASADVPPEITSVKEIEV
jgi:hypothetical protein